MKLSSGVRLGIIGLTSAALTCLGGDRAVSQDVKKGPNFGWVLLKGGFNPDPFQVPGVLSGGDIQTEKGDLKAWVSNEPDFRLKYVAGKFKLTIKFVGTGDTTLLVNTPDGKWVADDDSDGMLNPRITFDTPKSGQYDIWVGTVDKTNEKGTLIITEAKQKQN